ncbi:tetratricopeptide repeat protein [Aliikangiella coralliicola]|uniref:Tetratricopeptide repeat protein n=1 Tax=Aliikangiella coralliicola TaxID=2592383 RepID=A0A545UB61_9GAMM|nr:tetratricopeptide repeat protein [Aliikangiella coralliicola]TQV86687.1 tetratricopeptide repeat protein [Aliikangiella coralliicola]
MSRSEQPPNLSEKKTSGNSPSGYSSTNSSSSKRSSLSGALENKNLADKKHADSDLSKKSPTKRKRGVMASRVKLEQAMRVKGFKTQAALAEKIAEREELESAPRDMVNRVFRGMPVEPQTIERVAAVLSVEAYSLYLSSDEIEKQHQMAVETTAENISSPAESPFEQPDSHGKKNNLFLAVAVVSIVILFSLFYFRGNILQPFLGGDKETRLMPHDSEEITSKQLRLNQSISRKTSQKLPLNIAVVGIEAIDLPELVPLLQQELGESKQISKSSILTAVKDISPWEMSERLAVDYVIQINTETKGRHLATYFYLLNDQTRRLVYADVWTENAISQYSSKIAVAASNRIRFLLDGEQIVSDDNKAYVPLKEEAVSAYLNGMDMVDKALSLSYINQSLLFFERALKYSPHYIKAQAARCEAMSRLYSVAKDISVIKEALAECQSLADSGQKVAEYHYAMAQIYRRLGKVEQAADSYAAAIKLDANYVDAMIGLAENYLAQGAKTRNPALFKSALDVLEKAKLVSPDFWKIYHAFGRIYYLSGRAAEAIEAGEKSVSLSPNLSSLSNLGNFHFCSGKVSRAQEIFEQMRLMKYVSPLVLFQLGAVYSYYSEYEKAASLFEEYVKEVKDDNTQVHADGLIGLADIYTELSQFEKARKNYQRAFERLEQERLNGKDNLEIQVKQLYLKLALRLLDGKLNPTEVENFNEQLVKLEPKIHNPHLKLRLLFAWMLLEQWEHAKRVYLQLAPTCKAIADRPSFDRFKK